MNFFFRWSCLLGFALLAPTALPAGGGEFCLPEIRKSNFYEPFLSNQRRSLLASPLKYAPTICNINGSTHLKVLRTWNANDGSLWLYVRVLSNQGFRSTLTSARGWLNVNA